MNELLRRNNNQCTNNIKATIFSYLLIYKILILKSIYIAFITAVHTKIHKNVFITNGTKKK